MTMFVNHYCCTECKTEWTDAWECMCNDRCPKCNREIEPYLSVDITFYEEEDE